MHHVHLITVGISIISNYIRNYADNHEKNILKSDSETLKRCFPASKIFMKVYQKVKLEPKDMSAELNAMWNYIQGKKGK